MSLTVKGVWEPGSWGFTVWANGVWYVEGTTETVPGPVCGSIGASSVAACGSIEQSSVASCGSVEVNTKDNCGY